MQVEPAHGVRCAGGHLIAETATPWLRLHVAGGVPQGRWIALTYAASWLDPLLRPILRFVTAEGDSDVPAPAPLFGRAIWTGYVPDGTREILMSPVNQPGPFGFAVKQCSVLSPAAVLRRAWAQNKQRTLQAIAARVAEGPREARRLLTLALGSTPLNRYHAWRAARVRPFEPQGLDAARADWSQGPHIRLAVAAGSHDLPAVLALLQSLAQQPYPHWSLALLIDAPLQLPPEAESYIQSGRVRFIHRDRDRQASILLEGIDGEALVGAIWVGTTLSPAALAVLAEHALQYPAQSFFYSDEDERSAAGRYSAPRLKPDWSPAFQDKGGYIGRALFVRRRRLEAADGPGLDHVAMNGMAALLDGAASDEVAHIRRVLLTRGQLRGPFGTMFIRRPAVSADGLPGVTVIIPSRDRAGLLQACLRGLRATMAPAGTEVIIVDNGSVEPQTQQLYASLKDEDRLPVRVLDRPGPFNFALLCNEAARAARGEILVFLNNDIEMPRHDWLVPLLEWARRPDIGAVGARLLYPSGRLQHGGVVLGMAGSTAHIDRGVSGKDPGYLRRYLIPHEVSAVTAACLAVAKTKFDAVEGFDAENFPVELNDIDLCLRLAARGWRTLLVPDSVLVHRESASRGTSTAESGKYARERALFAKRWGDRLRDDPYFHPALSLTSIRTALG